MNAHTATPDRPNPVIELIRRLRKATHRPEPANDPTICAICGAPLTPDEIERLALVLWEHNGERPIVYESGKRIADRELEWWKQVAVSAWGFINGTEKEQ